MQRVKSCFVPSTMSFRLQKYQPQPSWCFKTSKYFSLTLLDAFQLLRKSLVHFLLQFILKNNQSYFSFYFVTSKLISQTQLLSILPLNTSILHFATYKVVLRSFSMWHRLQKHQPQLPWCLKTSKYFGCTLLDAFQLLKKSLVHCLLQFILKNNRSFFAFCFLTSKLISQTQPLLILPLNSSALS